MKTEKDQDKFLDKVIDFIEDIPDEDKVPFVSVLVRTAVDFGCTNHIESIGLLQALLLDLHADFNEEYKERRRAEAAKEQTEASK